MTPRDEQQELWAEALGDDAPRFWTALSAEVAPPMRALPDSRAAGPGWRWLSIAASVALIVSVLGNAFLVRELVEARQDYLLAALTDQSTSARFVAINALRSDRLSNNAAQALESLVINTADPNVQLAALEVLIESGGLAGDEAIARLLSRSRHNTEFLRLAVQARSTRI